jgi:hypothetical protein
VVPSGNIVSLAPIDLPLTHNWESGLDSKSDLIFISEGVRRRNVADVVPIVETSNVSRKRSLKTLNGILSSVGVPLLIVDTSELTLDASGFIEYFIVLINKDISPVRNLNSFLHILKDGKGLIMSVVDHDFRECERLDILKRTILDISLLFVSSRIR